MSVSLICAQDWSWHWDQREVTAKEVCASQPGLILSPSGCSTVCVHVCTPGVYWVKAKDAAEHPSVPRTDPQNRLICPTCPHC